MIPTAPITHSAGDVGCLIMEMPGGRPQKGGWKSYVVSFWQHGRVWRCVGSWQFPPSITCVIEMHACQPHNWFEVPGAS